MKNLFILLLIISSTLAMAQGSWTYLFDGKSLAGWHNFKKTTVSGWMIEDGALTTDGKGGDLVTDKEYGDFILEFEFKVSPKGNSGIVYKVVEGKGDAYFATYASGVEYQLIDDIHYPSKLNETQKTGANYDLNPPKSLPSRPAGEWNNGSITIKKNKIRHKVNGKTVVKYTYGDEAWKAAVAKSKFAKWPYANAHHRGKIALQGHNDRVYFRNIRIKEL